MNGAMESLKKVNALGKRQMPVNMPVLNPFVNQFLDKINVIH